MNTLFNRGTKLTSVHLCGIMCKSIIISGVTVCTSPGYAEEPFCISTYFVQLKNKSLTYFIFSA